jgi:hypothetical protein
MNEGKRAFACNVVFAKKERRCLVLSLQDYSRFVAAELDCVRFGARETRGSARKMK